MGSISELVNQGVATAYEGGANVQTSAFQDLNQQKDNYSASDWAELVGGLVENVSNIVRDSKTPVQIQTAPPPKEDNTLLYVGGSIILVLLIIYIFKK